METIVTSATRKVVIGGGRPTVLIGERINAGSRRNLSAALQVGNLDLVRKEALAQVEAGADIIDVNVGAASVDEVSLLAQAVRAVTDVVDVPICIDTADPLALEAALKVYRRKPLINSVTGQEHSLAQVLPLTKEYGAAVVGLVQDDEGIPSNSERRVAIAHKIVQRAEAIGIPRQDIIIDCLTLVIGTDPSSSVVTIETAHRIKTELGVNLILGASNVSFGLPHRDLLNNAFVAIAIAAGVNCLIVDVGKMRPTALAADVLLGLDEYARRYLEAYRQRQKQ